MRDWKSTSSSHVSRKGSFVAVFCIAVVGTLLLGMLRPNRDEQQTTPPSSNVSPLELAARISAPPALPLTSFERAKWAISHPSMPFPTFLDLSQSEAAYNLVRMGKEATSAIPSLVRSLDAGDHEARRLIIAVLRDIGAQHPSVAESLVSALSKGDLANDAGDALIFLACENTNVVDSIVGKMRGIPSLTDAHLRVLYHLGPAAEPLIAQITESLNDVSARDWAIYTLAAIGPDARGSIPALLEIIAQTENDPSRYAELKGALIALGRIRPEATSSDIQLRRLALRDPNAARALFRIAPTQNLEFIAASLLQQLKDKDPLSWDPAAVRLLGDMREIRAKVLLEASLRLLPPHTLALDTALALLQIDPTNSAARQRIRDIQNAQFDQLDNLSIALMGAQWQLEPDARSTVQSRLLEVVFVWSENSSLLNATAEMRTLLPALHQIASETTTTNLGTWATFATKVLIGPRLD